MHTDSRNRRRRPAGLRLEALEAREVPALVGGLDPSFGTGGKVTASFGPATTFHAVAVQSDGKIVAAGATNPNGSFDALVARFNPDGTPDATFNQNTGKQLIDLGSEDEAFAVAIQSDGRIVVGGAGMEVPGQPAFAVARLNPDGTLDATFAGTGHRLYAFPEFNRVRSLGFQSDGTIVVGGGAFDTVSGAWLARIDPASGNLLAPPRAIAIPGKYSVGLTALTVYPDGPNRDRVVAVGSAGEMVGPPNSISTSSEFMVARLSADLTALEHSTWHVLPPDQFGRLTSSDHAHAVALRPDGRVLVAGASGVIANSYDSGYAAIQLNPDLMSLDTTFNSIGAGTGKAGAVLVSLGGFQDARACLLQPDGRAILVGSGALVRLDPDGSLDPTFNAGPNAGTMSTGSGTSGSGAAFSPNGRIVVAGFNFALSKGGLDRVIGSVELSHGLAVGAPDTRALVYSPDPTTGLYPSAATITLNPFGPSAAGVRATTADVNGDGFEDTVAVTGPGTPIRVTVVSGADNSTVLVSPFDPFGGDFAGGGFVAAADLDGDGRAEFAVTPDQGGGPRVTIFSLSGGAAVVRQNFFGIDDTSFRGGARAALGDVNGDGTPDLAVAAGFQGGPRVALFDGASLFGTPTRLVGDFFGFPGPDAVTLRNGVFLALGDVDGDGRSDLILGGGPGGAPRVFILSGAKLAAGDVAGAQASPVANFFVAVDTNDRGGVRLAAKDADGDHRADVAAGSGEGSPSRVRIYLGTNSAGPGEPVVFQDIDPFGANLPGGVFVG